MHTAEELIKMAESENRKMRLFAMEHMQGREDIPIEILENIVDGDKNKYDYRLRFFAIYAMQGRSDIRADFVKKLLEDNNQLVRGAARNLLMSMEGINGNGLS